MRDSHNPWRLRNERTLISLNQREGNVNGGRGRLRGSDISREGGVAGMDVGFDVVVIWMHDFARADCRMQQKAREYEGENPTP